MESMYLTARETAERLGIKRDTLYAYVSRGLLRSQPIPGSRERGYRTEEVERLRAGRGLSRATRSEPFVPVIDSAICLIEGGRLYYRGHDAIRLAETTTLEDIAGLWRRDQKGADLIRRGLVLLADHELNASTFVARCVASTGATPYAVVSGALAALSGRRHGGASASAEALLHEIAERDDPLAVMAARLARNEMLPGLGHPLYPAGDP